MAGKSASSLEDLLAGKGSGSSGTSVATGDVADTAGEEYIPDDYSEFDEPAPVPSSEKHAAGEVVEFYVSEDGFGGWGQTWYRGQEILVEVGTQQWEDTLDRNGVSYLELLYDESKQINRWGSVKIRPGRWPGEPFSNSQAAAAEKKRNRQAPVLRV